MSFRRYSSIQKKQKLNYKPMKWSARKLMKAQKRLTRWYYLKLRKLVFKLAWDVWAIMVGIVTYMGAMWMIFLEFLKRG